MKTYKNSVVTVLLLTFTFFVTHDYFVEDLQVSNHSIVHSQPDTEEQIKVHIHESMHSVYNANLDPQKFIEDVLVDLSPLNDFFSLITNVALVPQRPPSY